MAEGIVPGAGLSLLKARLALSKVEEACEGDERSIASVLLLTEATLTEIPEEKKSLPAMGAELE